MTGARTAAIALVTLVALAVLRPAAAQQTPAATVVFYGAGSTRGAIGELATAYAAATGVAVELHFGSSGTLAKQIVAGTIRPDIFASADSENPIALRAAGRATAVEPYVDNTLCAVARAGWRREHAAVTTATLQAALNDPAVTVGTSTPRADPSGTYAAQILAAAGTPVATTEPQRGYGLPANARMLFGGYVASPPVPAGIDANRYFLTAPPAGWAVDVILTYCTAAQASTANAADLETIALPPNLAKRVEYDDAIPANAANPAGGAAFAAYLRTPAAQAVFARYGFTRRDRPRA